MEVSAKLRITEPAATTIGLASIGGHATTLSVEGASVVCEGSLLGPVFISFVVEKVGDGVGGIVVLWMSCTSSTRSALPL